MPIRTSYEDLKPTTAPTGVEGRFYYDSTEKVLKFYDGSQWLTAVAKLEGYDGFDNNGGGVWLKYIQISADSMASEHAQYRVEITNSSIAVYSADGTEKLSDTTSGVWTDFWNNVKSDGSDIRVFNQNLAQMYFWIENWDYANQTATIWVRLSANSSEINIAYGNDSAAKSVFEDGDGVFEFFDDFDTLDNWRTVRIGGSGFAKAEDGFLKLYSTDSRTVVDTPVNLSNMIIDAEVYVASDAEDFIIIVSDGNYTNGNETNGYDANWNGWPSDPDRQRLRKFEGGTETTLATTTEGELHNGETHILSMVFASPDLAQINDGTTILTAQDSTFNQLSYLGLAVWDGGEYWVDWIRVFKLADPVNFISTSTQTLGAMEGFDAFDNDGGGTWTHYINIPVTTIPSEYAQYKIVIQSDSIEVFSADGTSQVSGSGVADFWSRVKTDGSDIRLFDQARNQLYFWVESFDYSGQSATIWVNLTAGSTELNIAYGNPSATISSFNEPKQVFDIYEDMQQSPSGTLKNAAYYDETAKCVVLTKAENSQNGQLEYIYNPGDGFFAEFEFWAGGGTGADATWLYAYATTTPTSEDTASGGYHFAYDEYQDEIQLLYDGTKLTTYSQSGIDNSQWHKAKIIHSGTRSKIYYDDVLKIDYTDTERDKSNNLFGWAGRTGGLNNYHKIRNLKVCKLTDPADFGTPQITTF